MRRPVLTALLLLLLFPVVVVAQTTDEFGDDEVLVRVNGSDTVEAGETISVAVVIDGQLDIYGGIDRAAVVVNGDLAVLNGADVNGNLIVLDGTLTLRDGSRVVGDIYLSNDARWVQEEGASFTGDVHQGNLAPSVDRGVAWRIVIGALAGWFGSTLVAIAVAFIFAGIGGRQLWSSATNLSSRPGATILTTLAFWFGLTLLIIPAILSVVAIAALPLLAMIGAAIWFLGYITFGTRLGASLTGQRMQDTSVAHPYLASIAGAVVLQLVLLVAIGGLLVAGLIAWFGDNRTGLSLIFTIPSLLLYVIVLVTGLVGGGALVLRAMSAWSARI